MSVKTNSTTDHQSGCVMLLGAGTATGTRCDQSQESMSRVRILIQSTVEVLCQKSSTYNVDWYSSQLDAVTI